MNELRRLWVVVPAVVLAGLMVLLFVNRGAVEQLAFLRRGQSGGTGLIDQRPYETAQTLSGMAFPRKSSRLRGTRSGWQTTRSIRRSRRR
jgi:hypothetical protein